MRRRSNRLSVAALTALVAEVAALKQLPFVTPRQASRIGQVSVYAIYRAIKAGELVATPVGVRQWRIRPSNVDAWMTRSTAEPQPMRRRA